MENKKMFETTNQSSSSFWCLIGNGGMIQRIQSTSIITMNNHPISQFPAKHQKVITIIHITTHHQSLLIITNDCHQFPTYYCSNYEFFLLISNLDD